MTTDDLKQKLRLAEEKSAMSVEDYRSEMQREVLKFRKAEAENKKFKAELLRQKD